MSANISIDEGGKPRPFGPVKALLVQGEDGKYYPWVPESERQLGYKSIDKNGVYQAKKDGVYGWSSVSVNVPTTGSVTGKDPATGQEVYVHPSPEGELVRDVLPTEIRVITPPTKTTYTVGETIDYSGIVVHAYSATGQDMGEVPFDELVFPVSTAYNESGQSYATSDLDTGAMSQPIPINVYASYEWNASGGVQSRHERIPFSGTVMIIRRNSDKGHSFIFSSDSANGGYTLRRTTISPSGEVSTVENDYILGSLTKSMYNGKTAYWVWISNLTNGYKNCVPFVSGYGEYDTDGQHEGNAAWTAVFGTIINQSLPVQWPRTLDNAVLETSFGIIVTGDD